MGGSENNLVKLVIVFIGFMRGYKSYNLSKGEYLLEKNVLLYNLVSSEYSKVILA